MMSILKGVKNSKRFVLGYDLGEEVSQISFLASDSDLPETLSILAGAELYNIPTVLCKRNEVNQWFYGKEALTRIENKDGICVDRLIEKARNGERINVDGTGYDPVSLLTLFVKRTLSLLSMEMSMDMVDAIVFTTGIMDSRMIEVLSDVTGALSLPVKNIYYQSYEDSLYHYMLYQPEDMIGQGIIACSYNFGTMTIYDMRLNHRTQPVVVTIEKKYDDRLMLGDLKLSDDPEKRKEEKAKLDSGFFAICEEMTEGRIVNSVFLLGDGFKEQWMQKSLEYLCRTRRVFQGNNLFSKGASIAAREKVAPSDNMGKYVLLDAAKLKSNVGLIVKKQGQEAYHALLDAGENWYDLSTSLDIILDSDPFVEIIVTPLTGGEKRVHRVELEGLPSRPERTTRIRMKMRMKSADMALVQLEDMGFGELFESSHLTWTEEVRL